MFTQNNAVTFFPDVKVVSYLTALCTSTRYSLYGDRVYRYGVVSYGRFLSHVEIATGAGVPPDSIEAALALLVSKKVISMCGNSYLGYTYRVWQDDFTRQRFRSKHPRVAAELLAEVAPEDTIPAIGSTLFELKRVAQELKAGTGSIAVTVEWCGVALTLADCDFHAEAIPASYVNAWVKSSEVPAAVLEMEALLQDLCADEGTMAAALEQWASDSTN